MGEPRGEQPAAESAGWQRASFLELFFDLAFVFALNQVSLRLIKSFGSRDQLPFGAATPTVLQFLAFWILWLSMIALASRLHPDSLPVQIAVISSMAGAVVMGVAVARGFEEHGLVFASGYAAARTTRAIIILAFRLTHVIPVRVLFAITVSSVPWIIGALVGDPLLRGVFWAFALALDYCGFVLGYQRLVGAPVAGEHLAERFQQFYLITLGEIIFVAGRALANSDFGARSWTGLGLAFISIVLLWWVYFYRAGFTLPVAITRARNPVRESVAIAGSHTLMIGGVVLAGVGFHLYIVEPLDRRQLDWLIAILGGPALFLAGRMLFELQIFGWISRSRLAGLLTLGLLIPATWYLPPLAAGASATTVLAGVAGADAWRGRIRQPEARLKAREETQRR